MVSGGLVDDLERVISTKDSLQNHLSLTENINHTDALSLHCSSSNSAGYSVEGVKMYIYIYITVAAREYEILYCEE